MTARRVPLLLASLGWLWLGACARQVALPEGPVAWVAWLKGQVEVAGVGRQVRPAEVEMDLLLDDSLRVAEGAAAVLGLHNDHLVLIETSLPVREIQALRSPPDGRPVAEKLASLLDTSTLSERDRLEARNARIAGWHVRRNAASTVSAQAAEPMHKEAKTVEEEGESIGKAVVARDKEVPPAPVVAKLQPAPATDEVEQPATPGRSDQPAPKVHQAQRNEAVAPTPPAKSSPQAAAVAVKSGPPAKKKDLQPKGGEVAVKTVATEEAEPQESATTGSPSGDKLGKRRGFTPIQGARHRRERKAPPVVEVLGVEGRLDLEFQEQLLALLGDAKIREVIEASAPGDASSQEVVLRIEKGILLDLRLAAGREITSKFLEEWQRRHRGASTDTATVRARVRLDP